jgi:hypothetical protein
MPLVAPVMRMVLPINSFIRTSSNFDKKKSAQDE